MRDIVREGDPTTPHFCANFLHTASVFMKGSTNVLSNGLGTIRLDDPISCGDTASVGSPTVFINGLSVARVGDPTTFHNGTCTPSFIISGSQNISVN